MDSAKVTEVLSNILTLLGLTEDQIVIEVTEEENINISLTVPLDRAGVFVGRHGEGLAALRMIFSLILFQRFAFWPKLHLPKSPRSPKRDHPT